MAVQWRGLGVCVAAAIGCRALTGPRPLTPDAGGAGSGPAISIGQDGGTASAATPRDAGPDLGGPADAGRGDAGEAGPASPDAGDASAPLCPPLPAPGAGADLPAASWSAPTAVPFSCAPMPSALFFPRPGPQIGGAYARCASFADARAVSLALDRAGGRVALIGVDGVARIVDVASRTVVGLLAAPRAAVGLAAFAPGGDAIVTVARGERQVTLWRADTFAPRWTITLPGHTYSGGYPGAAAFSPDGTAALVSPGDGTLTLLDASTGAIRATRSDVGSVVLNAAYGWSGRRIALLTAPTTGMCNDAAHGGAVAILDPGTLTTLATPMIWPLLGDEAPGPGQLLVAADADLIITSALVTDHNPTPKAFRLSDGSPLPAPPLTAFPLALSPDGTAALASGRRDAPLQLVRLADGAVIAGTAVAPPTALAFSGDGSTVATGSSGGGLLGIWRPAAGALVSTCTADPRLSDEPDVKTSLSADGATIAVDWGPQIRVLRRADGSTVSTIDHAEQTTFSLTLSPGARYVIGEFFDPTSAMDFPMAVFRTLDGVQVATLGDRFSSFEGGAWSSFAFLSDDRRLDGALGGQMTNGAIVQIDLETGGVSRQVSVDSPWISFAGLSGDCPLIVDANGTLLRSCSGSQLAPVASNTTIGAVSRDGGSYLGEDSGGTLRGTSLWNIAGQPCVIRRYPPRPEEAGWSASETAVAISSHGGRVITGAAQQTPCARAPGFTTRVHDVMTDTVVDDLPPRLTSSNADLGVLAYGPVLWCAR